MNGYEMLVREFDALKEELKGLKADVLLLIQERNDAIEAAKSAEAKNAEMWAYYQAEEYKARQEALNSEGCRND